MTIRTQLKVLTNKRTAEVVDINPAVYLHVLPNVEEMITILGVTYKVYRRSFHLKEICKGENNSSIYEQEATLVLVIPKTDLF